jgi:hypothetical protein
MASTYMGLTAVTLLWTVFLFSQVCRPLSVCVESGAVQGSANATACLCLYTRSFTLSDWALELQMRTFVISGTVAQWYFSPRDSRARQVRLHPCRIMQ